MEDSIQRLETCDECAQSVDHRRISYFDGPSCSCCKTSICDSCLKEALDIIKKEQIS